MKVKELLKNFDEVCQVTIFDAAERMYLAEAWEIAHLAQKCEVLCPIEDADGKGHVKGLFDAAVEKWWVTPTATLVIKVKQTLTRLANY